MSKVECLLIIGDCPQGRQGFTEKSGFVPFSEQGSDSGVAVLFGGGSRHTVGKRFSGFDFQVSGGQNTSQIHLTFTRNLMSKRRYTAAHGTGGTKADELPLWSFVTSCEDRF